MSWAQRLKRVFGIEIETGETCGGKVKVKVKVKLVESIEDPALVGEILGHLVSRELPAGSRPSARGDPKASWGFRSGVGRRGPGQVDDAGVAGCAGGGPRCNNPGIAARFVGRGAGRLRAFCTGGRDRWGSGLADSAGGVFE